MITLNEKDESIYRPEWNWMGRNLKNYISLHPKAKGAKTLTEARRMAFGHKQKSFSCKCNQASCKRSNGQSGSHC